MDNNKHTTTAILTAICEQIIVVQLDATSVHTALTTTLYECNESGTGIDSYSRIERFTQALL